MTKRRIDPAEGMAALRAWRDCEERGADAGRTVVVTAVRFTLEEIGALHPGRSVEVRVPPAGAVQILPGATHRRGTPPAVVETDARTWLSLASGLLTWEEAVASSRVAASGQRTDLAPYLPLV
ncbi:MULTISPECIES: sterol carrier family protein [Actinomycetes]|uniref:sterol carrier family protein n=1 Tax=Actinomycetes TaxID=1760 RepID=UPI00066066A9|nr:MULTISPECIES: sterol carrier family protein [Actinomycetes]MCM3899137.1 sterol carrier family protein [Schaalia meyeri]